MANTAVIPGSFDPVTSGHLDIVQRSIPFFEKVYVAIGTNTSKKYLFSLEKRVALLNQTFADLPQVEVVSFEGLTVDLCKRLGCKAIVRGVRSTIDMEYERAIADSNKRMNPELETFFLVSDPQVSGISSSIVRELIKNRANLEGFVPKAILDQIY